MNEQNNMNDKTNNQEDTDDPIRLRAHEILAECDKDLETGCGFPACVAATLAIRLAKLERDLGMKSVN